MRRRIRKLLRSYENIVFTLLVVLASGVFGSQAEAVTYYISPSGSDSNSGTSSTSPWKTFGVAVPRLRPGDTLFLKNGTYGAISINCGSAGNAVNGTTSQPITIEAENERQALVSTKLPNPGPFVMRNCSYWTIEGLRVEHADIISPSDEAHVLAIWNSSNITLRRNLVQKNNRYTNGHIIYFEGTTNSLIEENEIYSFHRHGIMLRNTAQLGNNVVRRNYVNSRGYADISGGFTSAGIDSSRGDACFSAYPSSNNLWENDIAEDCDLGFNLIESNANANSNTLIGNIALSVRGGIGIGSGSSYTGFLGSNNLIENFVSIHGTRCSSASPCNNGSMYFVTGTGVGIGIPGDSTSFKNVTLIGGGSLYPAAQGVVLTGRGTNISCVNCLSQGWGNQGFYSTLSSFTFEFPAVSNNGINFVPSAIDPRVTNEVNLLNNDLGNCKVFVPKSATSLKGKGKNGADIGANILYRYENSALTEQPLWNPSTGEFPGAAIVAGVNDIAGSSRFDVHKRLNVNTNGCAFPTDYGSVGTPPKSGSQRAYWKFDEQSGMSVSDSEGTNTGTLVNGPLWTAGVKGGALSFNGIDNYVDMGSPASLNVTGQGITIQAWVKSTGPGAYKYIVSKTDSGTVGYALYTGSSGTVRFFIGNGAGLVVTPDVSSPWDDLWHQVVGTYDGSSLRLYIDAVERASITTAGNIGDSSTQSLNIGRFNQGGYPFKGSIDEVQIYDRALTPTEIMQLYATEPPPAPSMVSIIAG